MWVRLVPGEVHCERRGMYEHLPVATQLSTYKFLLSEMTPNTWYVYSVLRGYEQTKYSGETTPTLDEIYAMNCTCMSKEEFTRAIEELTGFYVKDPSWSAALPLVLFDREEDLKDGEI